MRTGLRVLHVEDDEVDAFLVTHALRRAFDAECVRVETAEEMRAALRAGGFDLVVSDWNLPRFQGSQALDLARSLAPHLPFLIVSGEVGEEVAAEAMRRGAHDFVAKGNLSRLTAAIERELLAAETRAALADTHHRLLIADRMISMGVLAAGIAHEINNPLSYLLANVDLALEVARDAGPGGIDAQATAQLREDLAEARGGALRIRDIVEDMRVFSAPQAEQAAPVDLNRVVESIARMAKSQFRYAAELVVELRPVPAVRGSESRVGQVLMNLLVNAAQAIELVDRPDRRVHVRTEPAGDDAVRVSVSDNGPGIPAGAQARLFEAFYTTKAAGKGTGLGLYICQGIVQELGGRIAVQSAEGVGTTFEVFLPTCSDPASAGCEPAFEDAPVLVVGANVEALRALAEKTRPGCAVRIAATIDEAVAAIAGGARHPLILCDARAETRGGVDLRTQVARIDEAQARRIVLCAPDRGRP
jgi:signal transduction histidine kinase